MLAGGATWLLTARGGMSLLPAYLIGINLATLCAYLYDKSVAGSGRTRVPESYLHALCAAGGSPAAFISQHAFRHKTLKRSFQFRFWLVVAVQIGALVAWIGLRNRI